jgi:3alpha(or 20beta)-hydroxysteroid dehydrogenase
VNSVHPGGILTSMVIENAAAFTDVDGQKLLQSLPIPRFAEPAEVSKLMIFLASDESSYSTGSEFVIDGGLLAGPGY